MIVLTLIALLGACGGGPSPAPAPAPVVAPVAPASDGALPESPVVAPAVAPPDPSLPPDTAELRVEGGPLADQLVAQAAAARARGLVPFVQLYGDWCASCRKLRAAMADPRMVEAFRGTFVVRIDTTRWGTELKTGLWVDEGYKVPAFYVLRDDGTFGASLTGDAWGPDEIGNMAPKLADFFGAWGAKR